MNQGKGAALKTGIANSDSAYFMFTDVDFPYTISSMLDVMKSVELNKGLITDFEIKNIIKTFSTYRTYLSKCLRWLNRHIIGLNIDDTQCGLKLFDKSTKPIFLNCRNNSFLLDLELILSANKSKIKITSVNVYLRP